MPKKPFSLRSVQCTHIKYAKKMKNSIGKSYRSEKIRFFCEKLAEQANLWQILLQYWNTAPKASSINYTCLDHCAASACSIIYNAKQVTHHQVPTQMSTIFSSHLYLSATNNITPAPYSPSPSAPPHHTRFPHFPPPYIHHARSTTHPTRSILVPGLHAFESTTLQF